VQIYDNIALYNSLKELSVIPFQQLLSAFQKSKKENIPLGDILLAKELISDENLGKLIAENLKLPFVSLTKVTIPTEMLHIVPEIVARNSKVIAFAKDKNGLKIAMANPTNKEIVDSLAKKTGEKILIHYATSQDIENALHFYQKEMQSTFNELLTLEVQNAQKAVGEKTAPVAKIVDLLIQYAYENKASDIHIEPQETDSQIRFRIDGVLHDVLNLPHEIHSQVVSRIKVAAKLRTDEHLSAQDGKMQIKLPQEKLDIRVSIVPIVEGEKVVLRLLSSRSRQFALTNLGMFNYDIAKVKKGFTKPYGILLSTGPTGSGKTTTIYAILKIINTRDKNIATIEDPVEYDIEGINQIQVNPKTNLTFADGLRSILRQDPDIIFIGEIRDKETAGIAVNAAMTGHLVLSTLHTNNAATTLPRLVDMQVEPFMAASTVNTIIGQRLVRKICTKCRYSLNTTEQELAKKIPADLVSKHFGDKKEIRLYQGKGCPVCHNTGYSERVGLFEVLEVTNAIRDLIENKAPAEKIEEKAKEEGMLTMTEDGLQKVKVGITTIDEVVRATKT